MSPFTRWTRLLLAAPLVLTGSWLGGSPALQDGDRPTPVKRVRRPVFSERDWDGIYFGNLYSEALSGPRPSAIVPQVASPGLPGNAPAVADSGTLGWNELIDAEFVEDEIKKIQNRLAQEISTPIRFQTEYAKSRQNFSMLSLWFAVIVEFPDDIRWKNLAPAAQPTYAKAAANARVGSEQAFQYAKARSEELANLIRGGTPAFPEIAINELDWSLVVDRTPTMVQLDQWLNEMKALTSSPQAISENSDDLLKYASLISAVGHVIRQPGMDDTDDEDYLKLCNRMVTESRKLVTDLRSSNLNGVAESVNRIERSCNACHQEWR